MKTTELKNTLDKHLSTITPGQPFHLTGAHTTGDAVAQGDLLIEVVESIPSDYELVANPTDKDRQLVPESGAGSHHRVQSLKGVKIYRPANWGTTVTDLRGPCIVFESANAVVHEPGHAYPHGTVFIDGPMTVNTTYQRNLDAEQKERRAMD